ncbi:MAG: hypothetical protein ACFB20_00685 [Opitutales bacterium]
MFPSRLTFIFVVSTACFWAALPAQASAERPADGSVASFHPEKAFFWDVIQDWGFPVPFSSWFESDLIPLPTKFLAEAPTRPASGHAQLQSSVAQTVQAIAPSAPDRSTPVLATAGLLPESWTAALLPPTPARHAAMFGFIVLGLTHRARRRRHSPER